MIEAGTHVVIKHPLFKGCTGFIKQLLYDGPIVYHQVIFTDDEDGLEKMGFFTDNEIKEKKTWLGYLLNLNLMSRAIAAFAKLQTRWQSTTRKLP